MTSQLNSHDDWKRYVLCRAVGVLVLFVFLASLGGCSGGSGGNTAAVSLSVAVPQKIASLASPVGQLWAWLRPWLPEVSEAVAVSVNDIAAIEVQVSAADINPTQVARVNVSSPTSGQEISLRLDVQAGNNRTFTVYGFNARNERIYRGSQSGVTLTAGGQTALTITLADIPRVTSVIPADGATDVSVATAVDVTFSKAMNASTITSSSFSISGVPGTVTCNNPCTQATFTPATPLQHNTTFTVTVDHRVVTDTLGTPMNSIFTSTFRTASGSPATGTVNGTITNATTGEPIDGATVSVLTTSLTATTGTDGTFVINNVPAGSYTVEASKSGFVTNSSSVTVTAGSTSTVSISLAPANAEDGQIRIILNWRASPRDLDSHLLVPTPGGDTEVFFDNRGTLTAAPLAQLDIDDTDGFGPETITIAAPAAEPPPRYSGTYCYFVHNRDGSSSTELSGSGATVQVLNGNAEIARFDIPTGGNGIYWAVFTLDGDTGDLTPVSGPQGVIRATPGCD